MEDIYTILVKHFSGLSDLEEEKQINEYKKLNAREYTLMHKLWQKGEIEIYDFDTEKAWKKFLEEAKKSQVRTIPLFANIRKIAAVAAILIISSISIYYLTILFSHPEPVVTENKAGHPSNIILADGSVIWLDKNAVLTYPKRIKGNYRDVSLLGKAFFDVVKNKAQLFRIRTGNSTITVLGTSFNITADEKITEVIVQTGIVEVLSLKNNKKLTVKENQTAVVEEGNLISFETTNPNYLAWKDGVFKFDNANIEQVITDLNTYYSDRIVAGPEQVSDCSLTATFEKAPLEEIIEIVSLTCNLHIQKKGNKFFIQ